MSGTETKLEWQQRRLERFKTRYGRSGEIHHQADCRFHGARVCTCGLLHDLIAIEGATKMYPGFEREEAAQDDALKRLLERRG